MTVSSECPRWSLEEVSAAFDESLFLLKLQDLSVEMHSGFSHDKAAIWAEARKINNSGYYAPERCRRAIERMDEFANKQLQTCLEVWSVQGYEPCANFYRMVFSRYLSVMFAARGSSFSEELRQEHTRTGQLSDLQAVLGDFSRKVGVLSSDWKRKLEIKAKEAEHAIAQRETERSAERIIPALVAYNDSRLPYDQLEKIAIQYSWKELALRFRDLQQQMGQKSLRAMFTKTIWEKGEAEANWVLHGSYNPRLQQSFESLATIGARKLGFCRAEGGEIAWLDYLRHWSESRELDRGVGMTTTGSIVVHGEHGTTRSVDIENVSDISAVFCEELLARGTPEQARRTAPKQNKVEAETREGSSPSSVGKRARSSTSANMERIQPLVAALWAENPQISQTDMLTLLSEKGVPVPWPAYRSWDDAYLNHEGAVKTFLSKARREVKRSTEI